ncbi:glycosyltransferase [Kutzneria sp. CA-103260]|uniref:glycosyltransferase n=1 Tax=Kutzneria sp. CA-103260 TaxID=2802641 RepID=UPI001BAE46F1|nr:glycosyltransferase family 2 protein [Kutzneria sp. CA-103260]QUQ67521.1 glycosyl transferase family protein [Kutzneria sp. CA-103260]
MANTLWVVIPAFNEAKWIGSTLASLAGQRHAAFTVLVVDNASTDGTADVVRRFADEHRGMDVRVITETQKGTGAACDTGFRHAIANGATQLARTDADCLLHPQWTAAALRAFASGLEMVGGRLKARTDDYPVTVWEKAVLAFLIHAGALAARFRREHRGPQFLGPYVLCTGGNSAITADLYERCGGYPRTSIEEDHEDRTLMNRVRQVTRAYGRRRDMVVYWSMRRTKAWGVRNTLNWYTDHSYRPEVVDVR